MAWPSGSGVSIIDDEVALRRGRLVLRWVIVRGIGPPSSFVTRRSGQLSLQPSAGLEIRIGQGAVAVLFGWEGSRGFGVVPAMRYRLIE